MKTKLFISYLAVALLIIGFNSSCKQKSTDCQLTVITNDSLGMPLGNVDVKVYANVKTSTGAVVEADLKSTGTSDAAGMSTYTFKLPAILDVRGTYGKKSGEGLIKLEEGKSVEKIIVIR